MSKMKKYKVIDHRNRYRNDPTCEIMHDSEEQFVVSKQETDDQGNITKRVIVLNPNKFQEERIVWGNEVTLLMLKGIELEEVK